MKRQFEQTPPGNLPRGPQVITSPERVQALNALLQALLPEQKTLRGTPIGRQQSVPYCGWKQANQALSALGPAVSEHLLSSGMNPGEAVEQLIGLDLPTDHLTVPGGGTSVWTEYFATGEGWHLWYQHTPEEDRERAVQAFRARFGRFQDEPTWRHYRQGLRTVKGQYRVADAPLDEHGSYEHHSNNS